MRLSLFSCCNFTSSFLACPPNRSFSTFPPRIYYSPHCSSHLLLAIPRPVVPPHPHTHTHTRIPPPSCSSLHSRIIRRHIRNRTRPGWFAKQTSTTGKSPRGKCDDAASGRCLPSPVCLAVSQCPALPTLSVCLAVSALPYPAGPPFAARRRREWMA